MEIKSKRRPNGDAFLRTAIAVVIASSFSSGVALAQSETSSAEKSSAKVDTMEVTGTRISAPGVVSASPIYSVGAEEISLQQQPEVERILRLLPITVPSDGQNVNNGSAGAATVNLRGLGAQRNLILVDGKRLTPYNINGLVDTSTVPTALIERIDIVTGGASAVYGSDAMSGVVNFVMKRNFEGVELNYIDSITEERDGRTRTASALLGGNFADGRGNAVLSLNWSERDSVLLGQRPLGQLGIVTANGAGLADFRSGSGPQPPADPLCGGPGSVAAGGSTTTLPTRLAIAGGSSLGQFRDDGSLGSNCSVFNFNPFNYYQTPLERYGATALGRLELNDHAEAYSRFNYSGTTVRQQVAPSGVFGNTFFTPLANPFISDQARSRIIETAEADRQAGRLNGGLRNWVDVNENGVVDAADRLLLSYRRRTVEFGERSTTYDNTAYQFLTGLRGDIVGDWSYDLSFQRGYSYRTNISAGYTNVANIANALDSVDGVTCANGDSSCVPINLFGGFGSITPEMARYSSAVAIERQDYEQSVVSAVVTGFLPDGMRSPFANAPIGVSFGVERRWERGVTTPDECLKLAPTSCLGGAGGNTLPVAGGFDVKELFAESYVPLIADAPFAKSLGLEVGVRWSDYNPTGSNETWKYGANWEPVDGLLLRAMQQRAVRAPNVGELAAPRVTNLDNATLDPCSIENAGNIDGTLRQRCISTGMTDAQVGTVEDIVSGQVNIFTGTNLAALPAPEKADTTTIGFVWTPDFGGVIRSAVLSVDYYDIKIEDYIGTFAAQEVLDGCYVAGIQSQCNGIKRVGGTLTLPGSGVELFTTNLEYLQAEGIELTARLGFTLGEMGGLSVEANVNQYLTQESQSSSLNPVIDCRGYFGTQCGGPRPKTRFIQRTTWDYSGFDVSYLWRYLGSVSREPVEAASSFEEFRNIGSYSYFDLSVGYTYNNIRVSALVTNVLDKDPPVVGNEAGSTSFNSGNTFPSTYDTLGRVFSVGVNISL